MVTSTAQMGTHKTDGNVLVKTLLLTILIFAGLQCRLPYFTMTDDNLTAGYPFFSEVGSHLLRGEVPWYSDYLFGGHYDLLSDAQYFSWHPFYLLTSLLVGTPFHLCILDVDALFLYLVAAAGFVRLALYLRDDLHLELTDEWIIFCALSFTFTMMALVTCASWLTFENNAGALPWLALGILQRQWRSGLGLVTLFSAHQILGGHAEPLVSNSLFLTLFACGICRWRRSYQPLITWLGGYTLAVVLVLPLLIPMLEGFFSSHRSGGNSLSDMQDNLIPAGLFSSSFFFGTAMQLIHSPPPHAINGIFILCLANCAASWCLIPALLSRAPWRFLELFSLVLALILVVLISRPVSISLVMQHLPILRSMRWPFRELVQFQFFFHLFILLRPITWPVQRRFFLALAGSTVFVVPMLLFQAPPTFNVMSTDRKIILSGKFEPYWAQVRPFFKPTDRFVVLVPRAGTQTDSMFMPYSLIGAYDYPMVARITSGSGYSQTQPVGEAYLHAYLCTPWGAYHIKKRDELLHERPDLKFITVEQMSPLRVTLSSRDGPTIDLTPLIAHAMSDP